MEIQKTLILFLCMLACVKFSFQALLENGCTEDTKRQGRERHRCTRLRGCGYFRDITEKTIECNNIVGNLNLLNTDEDSEAFYPLTVKVTDSEIPLLPTSTFRNVKNVIVLFMENVKLKTIMPAAFNYLDHLKEIYLGQNGLTTISDGIFNTLIALEKLDLSRNQIETVTNHAFVGTNIRYLDLSHNNISELSEIILSSLTQLSVLDISYNKLKDINSFHDLKLHTLNLNHNNIEIVDFEVLQNTSFYLDFSFNNITEIINLNLSEASKIILSHNRLGSFEINENVRVLDLSYNNIDAIDSDLLGENLVEFYISFNSISSFKTNTFFGMYHLTHLYVDNNNLTSIPNSCFKDLSSLMHLNLSGNELTEFKFGTFDNLINLQVLDISNNHFKEMPQYVLHSLSKLTDLFFQNNEISNVNIEILIGYSHQLKKINLINNVWSCQKLVSIITRLKSKGISFSDGNSWEESNIHGIKCYENFENTNLDNISNSKVDLDNSKFKSFFNEDFTKTFLYKYFNQNFKESEFFKYLESLKKLTNSSYMQNPNYNDLGEILKEIKSKSNYSNENFKNSDVYNYFNRDFRNSSFFKYLETFRSQPINTNKSEKLDESKLAEFVSSLKDILRELEKLSKTNKSNEDFKNSDMYNYLNKDFKTSNFFKYLESLNAKSTAVKYSDISESTIEKLISPYENRNEPQNYTGLLSAVLVLLFIIICIMFTIAYRHTFNSSKYALRKEDVELISNN